jgi:hypothetical protein
LQREARRDFLFFLCSFDALGANFHFFAVNRFCLQIDMLSGESSDIGVASGGGFFGASAAHFTSFGHNF